MPGNVISLRREPRFNILERSDGHCCPDCRAPIMTGAGVTECPACRTLIRAETFTAPVYRTRTLLDHELRRIIDIEEAGGNPFAVDPATLAERVCKPKPRPRLIDPQPVTLSAATALAICAGVVIVGPALGWIMERLMQ